MTQAKLKSSKPEFQPTPEQEAIIQAALNSSASLMIQAYAGCAKTTTLELVATMLPPVVQGLALAFNVKIKKELEARFPSNFTVLTLNGLGHRAWAKSLGRTNIKVDADKLSRLIKDCLKANNIKGGEHWATIKQLVTAARQSGIVPKEYPHRGLLADTPENWEDLAVNNWIAASPQHMDLAREVLLASVNEAFKGTIDFDDQIYMSTMYNGVFPRYSLVMVDEAQDLSPLNHIQVRLSAAGRLIVVGDPKQAIYAFRGADSSSMAKLRGLRPEWIDLPLATTFRCPKRIVERQQIHAPGFRAWHTNPEGQIETWDVAKPNGTPGRVEPRTWTWDQLQAKAQGRPLAILCRNNAPILGMAFALLRQRVAVTVLGRDIGRSLIALSKRIVPQDGTTSADARAKVEDWIQTESGIAMANNHEERIPSLQDRGECLLAVLEWTQTAGDMRRGLESLFASEIGTVLATGHRAKGLEWDAVLHLDPWRVPSKHARKAAQEGNPVPLEQDLNLKYVIETRAKQLLILANKEDFS